MLDRYDSARQAVTSRWESTVVDVVLRHGSRSDAQALLAVFLADPEAAGAWFRCSPGTEICQWLNVCWPRVWRPDGCARVCRFPEFLPVLATKTGDPSWLGKLIEWGEGGASTDCNGGLILGIALHGPRARAEFTRLLWDPRWEASGGGTGSDYWAYAGSRVLGLSMPALYTDLVARLGSDAGTDDKRHCLGTFAALLDYWTSRPWLGLNSAPEPTETRDVLCDLLFEWSTLHHDDSLIGLAGHVLDHDDHLLTRLHELRNELHVRARHELEIRTLTSR